MLVNLNSLAHELWSGLIKTHNLRLCEPNDEEVIVLGPSYAILLWLDRDGLSFRYLDRSPQIGRETIDLADYLIDKRRWILTGKSPDPADRLSVLRQGLNNCAQTLAEVAPDILRGEKEWLKDRSVMRLTLTDLQHKGLTNSITACECQDEGSL